MIPSLSPRFVPDRALYSANSWPVTPCCCAAACSRRGALTHAVLVFPGLAQDVDVVEVITRWSTVQVEELRS